MDVKSIFLSKTLWLNLLGPFFAWLAAHHFDLSAEQQEAVVLLAMASANIIMRRFTNQPVAITAPLKPPNPTVLLFIGSAALLSGCATEQKVATFAADDLTHAQEMAAASNDQVSAPCYGALLPIAQKMASQQSAPKGLFTVIQEARDVKAAKAILETACGPLALDVMVSALKMAPGAFALP